MSSPGPVHDRSVDESRGLRSDDHGCKSRGLRSDDHGCKSRDLRSDGHGCKSRGLRSDDRAQTVLDYGIAVGIFFVALVFVLGTIPGMFAPFVGGSVDTQVADRLASSLSADVLTHPSQPFVLDPDCTEGFFRQLAGGANASEQCRFDTTATDLHTMLALDDTSNVRIVIQRLDGTTRTLNETSLVAGKSLPSGTSVSTARRTVGIRGESHTLEVYVW